MVVLFLWLGTSHEPQIAGSSNTIRIAKQPVTNAPTQAAPPSAPPSYAAPETIRSAEEIVGIGAVLSRPDAENGVVQITRVLPNSPAETAGLVGPLNIYKVDGISLQGVSLADCVGMLRGPAGSKVRLEVGKPLEEGTFEVEMIRQRVVVPSGEPRFRPIPPPPISQ